MDKRLIRCSLISLAPYERRVIELLRNSKDKRARKLAKKRVRTTSLHPFDETDPVVISGASQLY